MSTKIKDMRGGKVLITTLKVGDWFEHKGTDRAPRLYQIVGIRQGKVYVVGYDDFTNKPYTTAFGIDESIHDPACVTPVDVVIQIMRNTA